MCCLCSFSFPIIRLCVSNTSFQTGLQLHVNHLRPLSESLCVRVYMCVHCVIFYPAYLFDFPLTNTGVVDSLPTSFGYFQFRYKIRCIKYLHFSDPHFNDKSILRMSLWVLFSPTFWGRALHRDVSPFDFPIGD